MCLSGPIGALRAGCKRQHDQNAPRESVRNDRYRWLAKRKVFHAIAHFVRGHNNRDQFQVGDCLANGDV